MTIHEEAKQPVLNFYAKMAGAELLEPGQYVAHEGQEVYRADFLLHSLLGNRSVRFAASRHCVEALPDLTMKQAAYIVALSARKNGGILRVPVTMTERDKLRLYMAAQTHHLRVLVEKLERDSITAAERQLLGYVVRGEATVPVVEIRDRIAGDNTPYVPPQSIVQIDLKTGERTPKTVNEAIENLRTDLRLRALRKDSLLNSIPLGLSDSPKEKALLCLSLTTAQDMGKEYQAILKEIEKKEDTAVPRGVRGAISMLIDEVIAAFRRKFINEHHMSNADKSRESNRQSLKKLRDGMVTMGSLLGICQSNLNSSTTYVNAGATASNELPQPAVEQAEPDPAKAAAPQPANPSSQSGLLSKFVSLARSATERLARHVKTGGARAGKKRYWKRPECPAR